MTTEIIEVPATTKLVVMTTQRVLGCDAFLASSEEGSWVRLAFTNYGFCLNTPDAPWGSRITLAQFADAIESVVDCELNFVNRSVVNAMRRVHERMKVAELQGQVLQYQQ